MSKKKTTNPKHSLFEYVKLIFSLDKRLWIEFIFALFTELVFDLLPIALIASLTTVYSKQPNEDGFKIVFWIIFGITVYRMIIQIISNFIWHELHMRISRRFNYRLAQMLYRKLDEVDYETYQSNEFLNHYQKAIDNGNEYMLGTYRSLTSIIENIVGIVSIGTILSLINPLILAYALGIAVITYFIYGVSTKIAYLVSEKNMQHVRERGYIKRMFFLKDASIDLKTTNLGEMFIGMNDDIGDKIIYNVDKYLSKKTLLNMTSTILAESIIAFALSFIAYTTMKSGNIVILASLVSAATNLSWIIRSLTENIASLRENASRRFDFYRVMDQTCVIEKQGTINDLPDFEQLKFEHVDFAYLNNEEKTLNDISFTIKKNQKIAIVGENGAGKTTLVRLLLKLTVPTNGNIYYNDLAYDDILAKPIRSKFVSVFQNYQIYSLSVAENVLLKKLETKEEEEIVINALKRVGLWDKISKLEKGIHTVCTNEFDKEGVEFSGGERQKLVIARVFASNAPILVLDEPNSALDPLAEKQIFDEIFSYATDKTLIFISHRFSTTIHADWIYLFDHGKILEQGTHKELMALGKEYKRMFMTQAEKYQEEQV